MGYIRLRWRVADAVRLRENIWQTDAPGAPFVLGLFRPRIYLPFSLAAEDEAAVIAHEQAHILPLIHIWAYVFPTDDDMPFREHHIGTNYWWIELGGDRDSIHDADALRHELLRIALGVWDHVKNRGDHGADNWVLDWIGFLPGKRESRRYVGDVIITQQDVEACLLYTSRCV